MNRKTILGGLIFSILILQSLIINLKSSSADDFSAGVNPAVLQINAEPPANVKAPISLENQSDQNITYSIFLRPFKANSDKNGNPNYDPALNNEYKDFFTHVTLQYENEEVTEITLSPHERKDLTLKIGLPRDYEPRDYYFTVVFLSEASEANPESSSVGARGGIGTNVLLSVGTKSQPEGRIAKFSVPRLVTHGPVEFSLELANHNSYFVTSNGNLVIKNVFGQPIGNLEFGPTNILAASNRLVGNNNDEANPKLIWNDKFVLGIYKAELSVALSDRGPLLKQTKTFFAFPIEFFFILVLIIAVAAWLFKRARKRTFEND